MDLLARRCWVRRRKKLECGGERDEPIGRKGLNGEGEA
jgi:hypothetical protein